MRWLKEDASVNIRVGPFVDTSDGSTAKTGLTIAATDVLVSKNNAAFATKNSAAGATHDIAGYYSVPMDATDVGTAGSLRVIVNKQAASAMPVCEDFQVLPPNVFEALSAGTEWLEVTPLRPVFGISGTTLTIKKTDNTTDQFARSVQVSASAQAIVGIGVVT
jgi:hypothetical protein